MNYSAPAPQQPSFHTPNQHAQQQQTQALGLLIPGGPVRTDFVPVDASGLKFSLQLFCPGDLPTPIASVNEIVFFILPSIPLPPDHGIIVYWQISAQPSQQNPSQSASTGFELLGAVTPDRPSGVFQTGWSEHVQLMEVSSTGLPVILTIGVSLEPLATIQNLQGNTNLPVNSTSSRRLFVAQKIASDLFKFMQSFDTGTGGLQHMVVPKNIFDRWFTRFQNRFQRDPNFFLKTNDE